MRRARRVVWRSDDSRGPVRFQRRPGRRRGRSLRGVSAHPRGVRCHHQPRGLPSLSRLRRSRDARRAARALRRTATSTTASWRGRRRKQAATRSWRACTRGSASARARWCWRCATQARGWRWCRARGGRRSTPCSTPRRCAIASTPIVAAEDVTRGKPDPEGYRLARARLERRRRHAARRVAIEDAPAGLRAARDAGARCIGLATTCPAAELDGADEIVPSLAALDARALIRAAGAGAPPPADAARPILFTPGPVRVPPAVTRALADPPCNYHRQEAFSALRADIERDLVGLLGIRDPAAYHATVLTATGTGANEACLLALAGTGPGLIAANGFFAARLVEQAARNGIAHRVLEAPPDRPLDPADDRSRAGGRRPSCAGCTSSATRRAPASRTRSTEIGAVARRRGVAVAADVVSSAFAYPIDVEAAGLDLAVDVVVEGDRRGARAGDRARARGVPRAAARRARRRLLPGSRRRVRQAAAREPAALRAAGGAVRGARGGVRAPAIDRRSRRTWRACSARCRRSSRTWKRWASPPRCPPRTAPASP